MINPMSALSTVKDAAFRAARVVAPDDAQAESNIRSVNSAGSIGLTGPGSLSSSGITSDPKPVGGNANADVFDLSFDELTAEADNLRRELTNGLFDPNFSANKERLSVVTDELEIRSLDMLEEHLVNIESTDDNVLTADDLYDLAKGEPVATDVQPAAQFFMNHKPRLKQLDGADATFGRSVQQISLREIHTRQLELKNDIENIDVSPDNLSSTYALPDGVKAIYNKDSEPRNQALYDQQQDAIEQSIRTGDEVDFVNSSGQFLNVRVEAKPTGAAGEYTVHVGEDSFEVVSEIGMADTIGGIANVVEFGSAMGTPSEIRSFPDTLKFEKNNLTDSGNNWQAGYNSSHKMTYYDGNEHLQSPGLYYHELGHAVARDLNDNKSAIPPGWSDIHDDLLAPESKAYDYTAPETLVSGYGASSKNPPADSFAEAFAAYVNAKNYGEVALQEFRDAYPKQAGYIDQEVFGISTPPA